MAKKKDLKKIHREAEKQGWRIKPTKKGHYWMYAPDGVGKVLSPGTPSDHHSLDNLIGELRKHGFDWRR